MSPTVAVITDSSSTIGPDEYDNVFVVPMVVIVDNKQVYKDGIEIDSAKLNELLEKTPKFFLGKALNIKTSMPTSQDFIDAVNRATAKFDYVVCLPLSSGLSGTYNFWKSLLKQPPLDKYNNVVVLETSDTALSLRWLVEKVLMISKTCVDLEPIKQCVKEWANKIECAVIVDNLDQLVSGGRLKRMQAVVASFLKIKPIIRFHYKNEFFGRVFSIKSAIEKVISSFAGSLKINQFEDLEKIGFSSNISHSENEKSLINDLITYLQVFFKRETYVVKSKLFTSVAPAVISAHTGIDSFSIQLLRK